MIKILPIAVVIGSNKFFYFESTDGDEILPPCGEQRKIAARYSFLSSAYFVERSVSSGVIKILARTYPLRECRQNNRARTEKSQTSSCGALGATATAAIVGHGSPACFVLVSERTNRAEIEFTSQFLTQ
ncbi:hypothetical protein [Methylobacterium komagatae]